MNFFRNLEYFEHKNSQLFCTLIIQILTLQEDNKDTDIFLVIKVDRI